jgi:hypothetical protein
VPEAALEYLAKKPTRGADAHPAGQADRVGTLIALVLPTALMPAVEVGDQLRHVPRPRDREPDDVNLDTALQYNRWTSELAKFVGPKIGIAPAKLDHLIYGYGAGLGAGAVQGSSTRPRGARPVREEEARRRRGRLPLVGTFYRETPGADARRSRTSIVCAIASKARSAASGATRRPAS